MRIINKKISLNLLLIINLIFLSIALNSCSICDCKSREDTISDYLNKIRNNQAELTAFFSEMPKGGDLHNHFSGSVYAETYWNYIVVNKYFVDTVTLQIYPSNKIIKSDSIKQLGVAGSTLNYSNLRQRMLQNWSAKDYYKELAPGDKHFFDAFKKFPSGDSLVRQGLLELKSRAKTENVQYIELMLMSDSVPKKLVFKQNYDSLMRSCQANSDTIQLKNLFNGLKDTLLLKFAADARATSYSKYIDSLHYSLKLDDGDFTMRYLAYGIRTQPPGILFTQLYSAFKSASIDSLIVGVNIVSPEDNEVSMKDYWLHMQMFKYFHSLFPDVKYSMHAGELTIGLVKPEDLTYHIHDAVFIAGASRIGHGVDIAYEKNCFETMRYMHTHNIPVEINLSSNEFILKVKDDNHPIMLYFNEKVPIVISDDDAGILRTSLTQQYVLLAKRYPQIGYKDIKQFIKNGIEYSFLEDPVQRKHIIAELDKSFNEFENDIVNRNTHH